MQGYDLLNNLVKQGRLRDVTLSAYVINEVNPIKLFRENVQWDEDTKFVQIRTIYIKLKDKTEHFCEGILYASVDKSINVGDFCYLKGSLSLLSPKTYSKEVTLFKFVKENGNWVIKPVQVFPWGRVEVMNNTLKANLNYWKQFPMTLTLDDNLIHPMTRMLETEMDYSLKKNTLGILDELDVKPVDFKGLLTDIQQKTFNEMTTNKLMQLKIENDELVDITELTRCIRNTFGAHVKVYDLRGNPASPTDVCRSLKAKGLLTETSTLRVYVVTDKVTEGIPYMVIGVETLI